MRIPPRWWTQSQSIRTVSEAPSSFALAETKSRRYQEIAHEAERLTALGLSLNRIGVHLGVDDKTVAKAIRWMSRYRREA